MLLNYHVHVVGIRESDKAIHLIIPFVITLLDNARVRRNVGRVPDGSNDPEHLWRQRRPVARIVTGVSMAQKVKEARQDYGKAVRPQRARCLVRGGGLVQLLDRVR